MCNQHTPTVNITFICPSSRNSVFAFFPLMLSFYMYKRVCIIVLTSSPSSWMNSQGSPPKMISETNCRYEVEWVTEYACHRDYLESHTCKFTSEHHDISIDLTPLTRSCKSFEQIELKGNLTHSTTYFCYSLRKPCHKLTVLILFCQRIFTHWENVTFFLCLDRSPFQLFYRLWLYHDYISSVASLQRTELRICFWTL